jgi:hypothetical protein
VDLRDVTLEDGENAYAKMMKYSAHVNPKGPSLREQLLKVIGSPSYDKAVDGEAAVRGTKMNMLAGVVSKNREAAYKKVLSESPLLRAEINKRQLETGKAIRDKMRNPPQEQPSGLGAILPILGVQ